MCSSCRGSSRTWSTRGSTRRWRGSCRAWPTAAAAVGCAQAIGEAIRALQLEIRAGVHTGEVEFDGPKARGMAVRIGARVMSTAGPGDVLVSSTVKDLAAGSGLVFQDAGEHELKGAPDRWHMYRVMG